MNAEQYDQVIEELTEYRKGISKGKRKDYTRASEDVLKNFKNVAESTGLTIYEVWLVYCHKHWDSICSFVKNGGQVESEPIKDRISDILNYMELLWGLIQEKGKWVNVLEKRGINDAKLAKHDSEFTEKKLKVGDKVKIIGNNNDHQFDIGEVVTIIATDDDNEEIICEGDSDEDQWRVIKDDIEYL